MTLNEDAFLGKERDIPPPPPIEKKDHDMDLLEYPSVSELEKDVVDDHMEPMNPLDPPSCDPPVSKRLLWLHDTLQDVKRHATSRGTFKESKKKCQYQGYVVAMSSILQAKPHTFEEAVKEQVWKDTMVE